MRYLDKAIRGFLSVFAVVAFLAGSSLAHAQTARMALLIPDTLNSTDPLVTAWTDAVQEEGLKIDVITDTQFLTMMSSGTSSPYQGIILPDQSHNSASLTLISAIKSYVNNGGNAMLVFDFGALDENGFYPLSGPSRLSDLAGVNYLMYADLGNQTTALGPVLGTSANLRRIQVPPGKSMPYVASNTATVTFLSTSTSDPGGLANYNHSAQFQGTFTKTTTSSGGKTLTPSPLKTTTTSGTTTTAVSTATTTSTSGLEAISGYVYGYLTYPSYVTQTSYSGEVIATTPTNSIIAGIHPYGTKGGRVLFVNLPLTYLKGATDGMPMHGFLKVFSSEFLNAPRLSKQPNGVGGLTLNWHLDSAEALQPMQTLSDAGIWNNGPFSIDMTAGPDTVNFGDRLGFDLLNNPTAQNFLKTFVALGHEVGSHGGWIHDYYGLNVSETNQFSLTADGVHTFQDLLTLNQQATQTVTGRPNREYSSPEGNNPKWALNWSEQQGELGYYFTGHTGLTPTRDYRDGVMMNPNMWAFPVMPFGKYAVFEEFQDFNVSKNDVLNWYKSLINFNLQTHTSRLIYLHPPGAADWLDVTKSLMTYAKAQGANFNWYTMPQLATFLTQRNLVQWTETGTGAGVRKFTAQHPTSLAQMTWMLPKSVYSKPNVTQGSAKVSDGGDVWLVIASGGASLGFTSVHN